MTSLMGNLFGDGGLLAILVFREDVQRFAAFGCGYLAADRTVGSVYGFDSSFGDESLFDSPAQSDGSGFPDEKVGGFRYQVGGADDFDHGPRAVLLHLDRNQKNVQNTHVQQLFHEIVVDLGVHVVDVGFHHRDPFGGERSDVFLAFADGNSQQVGDGRVFFSGAVAGFLHGHGRHGAEGFRQSGQDGRARWA